MVEGAVEAAPDSADRSASSRPSGRAGESTYDASARDRENGSRQERTGVLLPENRPFDGARLDRRLQPELLVEQSRKAGTGRVRRAVVRGRTARASRCAGALAEPVEDLGGLAVPKRCSEIELCERRVRRLEMGAENAALVAAPQVEGPGAVRLVLEELAPDE